MGDPESRKRKAVQSQDEGGLRAKRQRDAKEALDAAERKGDSASFSTL